MRNFTMSVIFTAICASSAGAASPPEAVLANTSWYSLDVFDKLDNLTPAKRAELQQCRHPAYTFLMVGDKLAKRTPGFETVYSKVNVTTVGTDTRFELYWTPAPGVDSSKPNEVFVLRQDGEVLMNPSMIMDTGALKCKSVASPLPAIVAKPNYGPKR